MNAAAEHLLNVAVTLPDGDRVELVEAILATLRPTDRPPFDDAWREVILRRSAELQSGEVTPVLWSEVKRQARSNGSD